ncbi:MAG: hypothetical protein COT17_03475 [Elusimicrobia bacterium CG08_land_8_20_14_0_20_51_18]|nr:MAG: hypothetical protein COT17_03475 [Elusimicrobia bacterium CG08_land_8_20_14_0_20_51_18]
MRTKNLYLLLLCSLALFSCQKKEGFSIYVASGFHKLVWDSGEKDLLLFKSLRDSQDPDKIFLDAGGSFSQNHIENRYTAGADTAEALKAFGMDAVVVDSDALKLPPKELAAVIEKLDGKALSSNVYWKNGKTPEKLKRHLIISAGKTRVGLVATILKDPEKPDKQSYDHAYKIENPIYEINRNIEKIKRDCDLKVLVLNSGFEDLKTLKKHLETAFSLMVSKPDLIILSGSWTFDPFKLKNVWVMPSGLKGAPAFRARLSGNSNFKTKDLKVFPLSPAELKGRAVREDFVKTISEIRERTAGYFDKTISRASADIEAEKDGYSPLGDLLADSIKSYIKCNGAIINYSPIKRGLKAGEIKVRDLYEILGPEDNLTYTKVRGSDIPGLLGKLAGRKISVSGLKVVRNGKEITKILINGRPVNDGKIYRFLIPQSLINDDYSILSHSTEFSVLPRKTLDAALWYFRNHKELSPKAERRIMEE